MRFVAMSIETLGASPEQKAALEQVQADLKKHMQPAREADEKLQKTLADAAAAGSFDKAKIDAATRQVETASAAAHAASLASLDKLHAILKPEQRAALVDKVRAHWEVWRKANGAKGTEHEEHAEHDHAAGSARHPHLEHLAKELNLTADQVSKIDARVASEKAGPELDAAKVEAHIQAFETAFESEKFDAKKALGEGKDASGHMAGWGAKQMAHFVEAVSSVLDADQRKKLAAHLREHAEHDDDKGDVEP
jgi:Spy/CpxP family protein refolding chaperone